MTPFTLPKDCAIQLYEHLCNQKAKEAAKTRCNQLSSIVNYVHNWKNTFSYLENHMQRRFSSYDYL